METLLKDTAFLKSVIETMSEGLMLVDREGTILFFNGAAEEITGYKSAEVLGKPCSVLNTSTCMFALDDKQVKRCKLFDTGCVTKKRCEITTKDGRTVHLVKSAVVLKNDKGDVVGGVEVMTDITPVHMKELEVEKLKSELLMEYGFMGLLGTSPAMRRLYEQIRNAAASEAPVLITGESGTGKELAALAIHRLSRRAKGPFVKVNCAALNEALLESELFGHVRGAFTGAFRDRQGRFEAAHGGSILLDEIGDMSPAMQVKLLRVIQEKELERVGDQRPITVDVRLITATNKDLGTLMEDGRFREDLYYRINVLPLHMPPLRERKEDLPVLVSHSIGRIGMVNRKPLQRVSHTAMEALGAYHWPGNVRQLINALEYAAISAKDETIDAADLPAYVFKPETSRREQEYPPNYRDREQVLAAVERFHGNKTRAAKHLGISRVTLWKILKELKIDDTGGAA
jgi:PAS domain S-box-containing protein